MIQNRSVAALRWYLCLSFPFDSFCSHFYFCLYCYSNCFSSSIDVITLFIIGFFFTMSLFYRVPMFCLPSFLLQAFKKLTLPRANIFCDASLHDISNTTTFLLCCILFFIVIRPPKGVHELFLQFCRPIFFPHPKSKVGKVASDLRQLADADAHHLLMSGNFLTSYPFTLGVIVSS
jgi:hypothetical protein